MIKAIVTGHSKGLGAGIAAALLAQGIGVLGVSRGASTEPPALLVEVEVDLSDGAALSAWIAGPALRDFVQGASTILLVNNAGTVQPVGALADQAPDAVLRAVTLNVATPLALAAAVVRVRGTADCRILHVSSGAGRSAMAGWSVYCATKAALDRHAEAVALDGDASVRCVSLAPGVIDTGMQGEIRASTEAQFPNLARFIQMKEEGGLQSAEDTGTAIVKYLLAEAFGSKPVADIRG
ncbi:MAG: SDR family oxidoreductase [Pseudomonadota bacterium]|nr:SDR family oxidoreductase [Pseudomonadota bacterium]